MKKNKTFTDFFITIQLMYAQVISKVTLLTEGKLGLGSD